MKWFRFDSQFRSDPRMRRMSVQHRYTFIVLLCLAGESETRGVIKGLDDDEVAYELEMPTEEWLSLKAKFAGKGLIELGSQGRIEIKAFAEFPDLLRDDSYRSFRKQIFERDGFKCVYCGSGNDLTLDHVVPRSKGGSHFPENLACACRSCNSSKKATPLKEWRGGL